MRFPIREIRVARRERQLRYAGSWGGRWHRSAMEMGACFGLQGRVSGLSRGGIDILWCLNTREGHRAPLGMEGSDPPSCRAWWLLMPGGSIEVWGDQKGSPLHSARPRQFSAHIICQYFLSLTRFLSLGFGGSFLPFSFAFPRSLHCTLFASFASFAPIRVDPGQFPQRLVQSTEMACFRSRTKS